MEVTTLPDEEPVRWITCPECEASCQDRVLPRRGALRCGRCGILVRKESETKSLQPAWAFASAGLMLVILANVNPVLTFDVAGNTQSNLIVTGVVGLTRQGYWPVAALVGFAGILGPALHLGSMWYVLTACELGWRLPAVHQIDRAAEILETWNLVPVYAVATVVSVVKLDMLGTVEWQVGAFWIVLLSLSSLLAMQYFDRDLVEKRLEALLR